MTAPTDPDAYFLVCMRATAPLTTKGSTFVHRCSGCRLRVMVAPSGSEFLEQHPGTRIVCLQCYKRMDLPADTVHRMAADNETIQREQQDIIPNKWRERN